MSIKNKLKAVIKFILNNIPARKFDVQIVNLHINELLKGRVAFITGGTSGIGFHIAEAFLHSGAAVIITGRSKERLQKACELLNTDKHYSNRLFYVEMDNTKVELFSDCFQEALSMISDKGYKQIDILVNNAGILGAPLSNTTEEEFDNVMDTNLKSVFFLSRLFASYMRQNRIKGDILNIGSSSSLRPAISGYMLSKWGIRGLTLGLAKSFAPYGIVVNGIAPGPTATPMSLENNINDVTNNNSPIGRYALPEEIANMAVILTSSMGQTILGDMIYMTGGSGIITYDDIDYSL